MGKRNIHIFASLSLAFFLPSPSRFYCGIALVSEFLLLVLFGTLSRFIIKKLSLPHVENVLLLFLLVSFSIFFQIVFFAFFPLTAFQLQFAFYVPVFSAFVLQKFLGETGSGMLRQAVSFSVFALAVFLLLDIFGYGTVSFFGKNGITEIILWKAMPPFSFLGTVPGGMMTVALIVLLYDFTERKFSILKNAGEKND